MSEQEQSPPSVDSCDVYLGSVGSGKTGLCKARAREQDKSHFVQSKPNHGLQIGLSSDNPPVLMVDTPGFGDSGSSVTPVTVESMRRLLLDRNIRKVRIIWCIRELDTRKVTSPLRSQIKLISSLVPAHMNLSDFWHQSVALVVRMDEFLNEDPFLDGGKRFPTFAPLICASRFGGASPKKGFSSMSQLPLYSNENSKDDKSSIIEQYQYSKVLKSLDYQDVTTKKSAGAKESWELFGRIWLFLGFLGGASPAIRLFFSQPNLYEAGFSLLLAVPMAMAFGIIGSALASTALDGIEGLFRLLNPSKDDSKDTGLDVSRLVLCLLFVLLIFFTP